MSKRTKGEARGGNPKADPLPTTCSEARGSPMCEAPGEGEVDCVFVRHPFHLTLKLQNS